MTRLAVFHAGLLYRVTRNGWEVQVGHRWFPVTVAPSFPPDSYRIIQHPPEVTV